MKSARSRRQTRPSFIVSIVRAVIYNQSKVSTTSGLRAYPANVAVSCKACKDEGLAGNGSASRSASVRAGGNVRSWKGTGFVPRAYSSLLFSACPKKKILKSKIKSASEKSIPCAFAINTDGILLIYASASPIAATIAVCIAGQATRVRNTRASIL